MLDAYSDGSVLAKGVEGSAAALVRVFGTDVSATVRLASVDVALSSGRSEWAGLVMVLYILREVRASVVCCVSSTCRWSTSLTTGSGDFDATGCDVMIGIWQC